MKHFIAALIALFTIAANAQILIPLQPCITDRPDLPLPTPAKPVGLPQQMQGDCTSVIEANGVGAAAAFWCKRPAPQPPKLYLYAVRWDAITPAMLTDYAALGLPGDNAERIRAMQAKYQTKSAWDMCEVWEPMRERINAAMPASEPLPVWKVAPNGTYPDRPSYAVTNGVRATTSKTRALVGAACDMSVSFIAGTTVYGTTSPGFVAVCSKVSP